MLTGKDQPNAGLVNVVSYDILVKQSKEILRLGYKVIIVVSTMSVITGMYTIFTPVNFLYGACSMKIYVQAFTDTMQHLSGGSILYCNSKYAHNPFQISLRLMLRILVSHLV